MRILLVEDDEILVDVLLQSLASQHHVVDVAEDGQLGWEYAHSSEYELILLDVGLPELDGIRLCEQLRSEGCSTPILLMTAKDASQERIRGLDAGADDYLIKPLDLGELHARIRALSRRGEVIPTNVLEIGGLRLDPVSCQVSYQEQPLKLTPKEYSLLELFLRNPSRVFSRGQIIDHLWTFDDPPQEESVKAHIKGLRKKLKQTEAADWIENVYGIGYRLHPQIFASQPLQKTTPSPDNSSSTHSSIEQEFNQKMNQMWQQYQGLMAERLEVLQTATTAVEQGALTEELHRAAERAAHKLAGVLGMFEREAGTNLAREIESLLQENQVLLPAHQQQLVYLVRDLQDLLALEESSFSPTKTAARLLLVDRDRQLGKQLEQLAQPAGMNWKQVEDLSAAKAWLQDNAPYLVVLNIEQASSHQEQLALIRELAARTPPVSALILSGGDSLLDRVTVARCGASGFLVKPVTATQVWNTVTQLLQRDRSLTTNVLVVDDDPVFLAALRPLLEPWGIAMTALDNPLHFWQVLHSTNPDLLILDVEMPEINGIELCQAIRTDPDWQSLPILFLTAHRDTETIQQVFAAGADDYVTKPIIGPELLTRITNRLERNRLLQNLSRKDLLTGLINQPQSSRELESLLQQAQLEHQSLCIALLSIPELRQLNIKYGHTTGNQVLQRWGRLLQAAFRSTEVLGYWGNGEFVIGIAGLSKTEMSDRFSEILASLRKQIFTALNGSRFQVLCQYSIAEYPTDGQTIQSLYQFCYRESSIGMA
ncbi:response regulator [Pleurocapsales cyanobacterium LEGE 06147]|nr:response regulator [Pleurocapsales cyanobacterium LEGE 06147]